ncbi:hypothetical protein FP568_15290 [Pandoraea pnomenusa]|uniref:hypothetical protein n=1 Tax=Pandoraea pnomenusa TaxID=93220 RepID=UPI0011987492|nr:hypothetical protein [Pandoraea pnomenusa]QDX22484.1 hypothetical protein FP568_15290 [Pandoraea pnomenusa]
MARFFHSNRASELRVEHRFELLANGLWHCRGRGDTRQAIGVRLHAAVNEHDRYRGLELGKSSSEQVRVFHHDTARPAVELTYHIKAYVSNRLDVVKKCFKPRYGVSLVIDAEVTGILDCEVGRKFRIKHGFEQSAHNQMVLRC